ncbi:peptidase inhibitor family I36 protein [Streptomyces sp. NPDC048696]|uniref:peptidase inhibitor family I36 protein n=1 Tax=Streptomyces sp. NPDC048696 TaxID=3365585 RepID=UPI0037176D60
MPSSACPAVGQIASDKRPACDRSSPVRQLRRLGSAEGTCRRGILYEDWNYGGGSLTLTVPAACKDDGKWDWEYDNLDDWNDRVSSLIPANNCYVVLYSDIYYNGTQQQYNSSTPCVGAAMNDRARSLKLL